MAATRHAADNAKLDFLENMTPAIIVAKEIKITDSYASLHGACPETYHLNPKANKCKRKPKEIKIFVNLEIFKMVLFL